MNGANIFHIGVPYICCILYTEHQSQVSGVPYICCILYTERQSQVSGVPYISCILYLEHQSQVSAPGPMALLMLNQSCLGKYICTFQHELYLMFYSMYFGVYNEFHTDNIGLFLESHTCLASCRKIFSNVV